MTTIVSTCTNGLGNRLKTYISCMARYDDVKTFDKSDAYIFQNLKLARKEDINKYPTFYTWRLIVDPEEEKYIDKYKTIDFLYEKTPKYFIKKYLTVFKKLKINPEIEGRVSKFSKGWKNVIGLHIRSWYGERKAWYSNRLYDEYIAKCNPSSKIFLCTDNSDVFDYFISKYGKRIFHYPQKRYNKAGRAESRYNKDLNANVNAFTDMYLLSKCSQIIGTYASTFTECAWWLGGCKSKVIIPKPNNVPQDFVNNVFVLK